VFSFTIRDLIWLMLAASFGSCWFVDHQNAKHFEAERDDLSIQLMDVGVKVEREFAELRRQYERR
jgi:hypothetical protein